MIAIRSERPGDEPGVRRIDERAFGGQLEAGLVERLRASAAWLPELALVAEAPADGAVVGHIVLSEIALHEGPALLSLAPVAVEPTRRREGIGSALG